MSLKEKQTDYQNRINRVFQYIEDNLDGDLSLNTIAEVAYFSPFHFHRVFKYITDETLKEYVSRQRIEHSAIDLIHKDISITEIASKYGFAENSTFTRSFKKYYGVSPTAFKKQNPNQFSKIRQLESKNGQAYPDRDQYLYIINHLKKWITMNASIEVKEMPKMDLAYVSSIGSENLSGALEKIIHWATPKQLFHEQTKMVTIYHDSYKVTAADKVRMTAGIVLDRPVEVGGEIGLTTIEAERTIVARFEIGITEFEKSWTGLFVWMNENGYKKSDSNPYEIYHNDYRLHPQQKCIVDICIPVE